MATDLAAQRVRNAELIQERDALAVRVEAMREALKYYANFGDDDAQREIQRPALAGPVQCWVMPRLTSDMPRAIMGL